MITYLAIQANRAIPIIEAKARAAKAAEMLPPLYGRQPVFAYHHPSFRIHLFVWKPAPLATPIYL